jgi:hypothetical protein
MGGDIARAFTLPPSVVFRIPQAPWRGHNVAHLTSAELIPDHPAAT